MASVVMADDGIAFDGATAERAPLGGAETAFVALAEALRRARPSRRGAQPLRRAAALTTASTGRRSRAAAASAAISTSPIAAIA